jgi:hypothetical protein
VRLPHHDELVGRPRHPDVQPLARGRGHARR